MIRLFQSSFEEIKEQFIKNYSKDSILYAKEQDEFEICIRTLKKEKKFKVLILDYFLLYDILTEEENIYNLKRIDKKLEFIVLCGPEKELNSIYKKLI